MGLCATSTVVVHLKLIFITIIYNNGGSFIITQRRYTIWLIYIIPLQCGKGLFVHYVVLSIVLN